MEASKAWVSSHGGLLGINEPLQGTEQLVELYWPPVDRWGDVNRVGHIMIYIGKKGAPYPFRVDLCVGHTAYPIYAADFPSFLQLLEQMALLALAGLLTVQREEERDRRWEKQQRKERKRKRKLQEEKKKAKAPRELAPVSQ